MKKMFTAATIANEDAVLAKLREERKTLIKDLKEANRCELATQGTDAHVDALAALSFISEQIEAIDGAIAIYRGTKHEIIREQTKAETREKCAGYTAMSFDKKVVWGPLDELLETLMEFKPDYKIASIERQIECSQDDRELKKLKDELAERKENERIAVNALKPILKELEEKACANKPITVSRSAGRSVRMLRSMISDVLGVEYDSGKTEKVMILNHGIQETFNLSWRLFSEKKEEGEKLLNEFQKRIEFRLGYRGVVVMNKDGGYALFAPLASSAGHQKKECVLMGRAVVVKEHSDIFWWGKTMDEFVSSMKTTGAEFWKARANMGRPLMKEFKTSDGRPMKAKKLLVVKDVEKNYEILDALAIGNFGGKQWRRGKETYAAILGDGAMISLTGLQFQGQCSGMLFKGMMVDGSSAIEYVCRKYDIDLQKFLDTEVEGIDGKMHRIGDFDAICGEGCWKGDKVFTDYNEYLTWLNEMSKTYEGIDGLYLLRQAEEIEDEEKVRTLTRTLIQQFLWMSAKEIRELSADARWHLKKGKTFKGALRKLAGLFKTEEERTEVEQLFEEAPWLVMAPQIQKYLSESWNRDKIRAMAGKFRTEGQYPYIMQDPVALLEVWVLGMNPDDPTLGCLKSGEVSAADVADRKKLLCVRFPANFLTAKVMKNKACVEEFASLNGVMVVSIHDLILIVQDGDVDGDEMSVIYNELAIRLVERMLEKIQPPVVLFQHGNKPTRTVAGTKEEFVKRMMNSLWEAKKFDSVGLYANLAMKCAYLASIALKHGDQKALDGWLLKMAAASTGAIIAIDQVKGNAIDEGLIAWLNEIQKDVSRTFNALSKETGLSSTAKNPYIQFWVAEAKRKPIAMSECLPENPENFLDSMSGFINRDVGTWEGKRMANGTIDGGFDSQGVVWNAVAAEEALTTGKRMTVPYGKVSQEMVNLLGENWFRLVLKSEVPDPTEKTLKKIKVGEKIGLKEFAVLLWLNEQSMAQLMEGRELWEKKEEYTDVCRKLLWYLAKSGDWSKAPGLSNKEKWNVVVNNLVRLALELGLGKNENGDNGIVAKGSFAMFVLRLVANELLENVKKNKVDYNRFFLTGLRMEDLLIDEDEQEASLFEATPDKEEMSVDQLPDTSEESIDPSDMPDDIWPEYDDEE